MALTPFKSRAGFDDGSRLILSGNGAPATAQADAAPVGSEWTDTTNGDKYTKKVAGAGAANWERLVRVSEVAQLANGSWREPADLLNTTHTSPAAAVTAMNASNTLDGVTLAANMRILFTGFTAPNNANVYIVGGSAGAWTLTEDTNPATAGDVVRITQGTYAGQAWQFIGGAWQYVDAYLNTEDQYIRAFVGKSAAGNVMPLYTNNNYILDGDALTIAVSKLDGQIATNAANITTLQSNLNATQNEVNVIESSVGLNVDGTLPAFTGAAYIATTTSHHAALTALDSALATLQGEVDATQAGAGLAANGNYTPDATATYIAAATSIHNATQLLDAQVATNAGNIATLQSQVATLQSQLNAGGGVTGSALGFTTTVVDSVNVDTHRMAEWLITVEDAVNSANRMGAKVVALHNGTANADATAFDGSDYAACSVGTPPTVDFSLQLTGVGAAQTLDLVVTTTASANVYFRRIAV